MNARYGRTDTRTTSLRKDEIAGDTVCIAPTDHKYNPNIPGVDFGFLGKLECDPHYPAVTKVFDVQGQHIEHTFENIYSPDNLLTPINRVGGTAGRREEHTIVDFDVGKDVGLGRLGDGRSSLSAGVRFVEFRSSLSGDMNGIPDLHVPEGWGGIDSTFHQYTASFEGLRKFRGAGPTLSWEASRRLLDQEETGHVNLDWALTAGVLFGKQKAAISGMQGGVYHSMSYPSYPSGWAALPAVTQTPFNIRRDKSVAVPVVDLSLGLSFAVSGVKLSTGYRWERYFNVLDGGYQQHESFDRTLDGPYFRMSLGFGS